MAVAESGSTVVPYQQVLRAIGHHLDGVGARGISIIEEPRGFVATYTPGSDPLELVDARFTHDALASAARVLVEQRRRNPSEVLGHYEDVLRALGYELEQQRAYSVLVAEIEDEFLITYQYLNPTQGYLVRKHMAVIGADGRSRLLEQARSRRSDKPEKRRSLRDLLR